MRLARAGALTAMLCAALAVSAGTASAATFVVANVNDAGDGSLRNAIEAANFVPGPDSIPISVTGTIKLATALPVITGPVAISGPGADRLTIRRDTGLSFRILELAKGPGAGVVADSISGVTIANGLSAGGSGILDEVDSLTLTRVTLSGNVAERRGGSEPAVAGGALASRGGAVTLRESTVNGNQAIAADGSFIASAIGGGLQILGGLRIEDSTISGNTTEATGIGGLAVAQGGGVFYESGNGEPAVIVRSTISGNAARAGGVKSLTAVGGGIDSFLGGLTITGSTVTGNSAGAASGASAANLAMAREDAIRDSIVSHPLGAPSCSGPIPSQGFNIEDGASCGLTQASDLFNVDPGLDPKLAANGGLTLTHALLPGSAAIDRGSAFGASVDQRGMARPSDFATVPNPAGRRRLRHRRLRAAGTDCRSPAAASRSNSAAPDRPQAEARSRRDREAGDADRARAGAPHPQPPRRLPLLLQPAPLPLPLQARPQAVPSLSLAVQDQGQRRPGGGRRARARGPRRRRRRQCRQDPGAVHLARHRRRLKLQPDPRHPGGPPRRSR